MDKLYYFLGQLGIYAQIFLWMLAFYWTDLEVFSGIMQNMKFPKNFLFLLIVIFSQFLLFRNFYYAVKIHSYAKNIPFNINEEQESLTLTQCKKCNFRRQKRAHHCRYCNKCIEVMDHHCFSLNNCIGKNNYHYFIGYIFLVEINSTNIFWATLYKLIYHFNEISLVNKIKYGAIVIVSFSVWTGMFFLLCFHAFLSLTNMTTLEFNYSSLRVIEEKKENNDNDKNWKNYLFNLLKKILRLFCP